MKKFISLLLSLIMVCSLSVGVFAEDMPILISPKPTVSQLTFKDVAPSRWSYEAIMEMTELGLFSGTTTPINGVGTFSPTETMTRAQFITVLTRYLWSDEIPNNLDMSVWYSPNWTIAVEKGLITGEDFGGLSGLNDKISREEMTYIMANVLESQGEEIEELVDESIIGDFSLVDTAYANDVLTCYSLGIITGYSDGNFGPKDSVTREQGAIILYRLINPEVRQIPTIPIRAIPSLNLQLSLPEDNGEYCGYALALYLEDKENGNGRIDINPMSIIETKTFNYNGTSYTASENNHYLILNVDLVNTNISDLNMNDYSFKVMPNAWMSEHDSFVSKSILDIYETPNLNKNYATLCVFVFEIPSTYDFYSENSLCLSVFSKTDSWSVTGTLELI